jgi:predicted O-methyltransferase YrrM
VSRLEELFTLAGQVKGFMPPEEGRALYDAGITQRRGGTWLEIGAWCAKSAIYLGAAAEQLDCVLFSLDHHHGSEENQRGWEYFDEELVDPLDGRLNTLPHWQRNISRARLEDAVVGLVGSSQVVAAHFSTPLDVLFIDGGHGHDVAWADYRAWAPQIVVGGSLLIHDVFEDPSQGGRPPYEIYLAALASGDFCQRTAQGSLRWLIRT